MRELAILLFFATIIAGLYCNYSNRTLKERSFIYWSWYVLFVCFVAFRPLGIDQDSVGYSNYYDLGSLIWVVAEPTFSVISGFVKYVFNDFRFVLIIYAIVGVWLKFKAIGKLTELKWLTLLVYFSTYFLLHEFTQIRASVASGIFLLSLIPLMETKRMKYLLLILIAIFFHYSSIVLLPLVFISNKKLNTTSKYLIALAIPFGIVLHYLKFNPIVAIPIETIEYKLQAYQDMMDFATVQLNVFNLVYLVKYLILYFLLLYYDAIYKQNKNISILLKIYALSLFAYLALSSNTIISMRISELLGIVEIILIPYIYYVFKPRYYGAVIIAIIAAVYLVINIYSLELIYAVPKLG